MTQEEEDNAVPSTVPRKLYLATVVLATLWAIGICGWYAIVFFMRYDEFDELSLAVVAVLAVGPLLTTVVLNRLWGWLHP